MTGTMVTAHQNPQSRNALKAQTATLEYRAEGRHVALYENGARLRVVTRRPITLTLAGAIAEALNGALARGAEHGVCDRMREMANALSGQPTPGHVHYEHSRDGGRIVVAREDGCTPTPILDLTALRPAYIAGDVLNELWSAFRWGGEVAAGVR
ncbi:hypothetical protein AB0395_22270 [Streptosporangium sp. NPDC051023]|uniref:hypothetical protein n=1 Tax=Streptosporangium sp. NPDC051023 TaxID=3155410 RepID=UPI00344FCBF6